MKGGYADDDIEDLAQDHPDKVICQLCSDDLTSLTTNSRQLHYDTHFSEQYQASAPNALSGGAVETPLSSSPKPPPKAVVKTGYKPPSGMWGRDISAEERNVFWHASQASEPPENFSPGLIPVLKKALARSHDRGPTQRAWLAFEHAVHVRSERWDRNWGCGYRNYLMACAALMDQQRQPMYFPLLDAPTPPGLLNLQELLEEAWRNGFDEEGAQQLDHKLAGTSKWIGTADLYVAFTYREIPAQLVDFNDLKKDAEPLLRWVYDYFSGDDSQPKGTTVGEALLGARAVVITDKLPIILQHQGHSRTIVGCERVKNGSINLLTFDPSKRIPQPIRQAGLHNHNPRRPQSIVSSPSKVHKVMHPVETIKSKKRKSLEPHPMDASPKRKRGSSGPAGRSGDEVIVIDSDSEGDEKPSASGSKAVKPDVLNHNDVLKLFRIDAKSLKKDNYQILYFPLDEPLTEQEKWRRRIVTSHKIT